MGKEKGKATTQTEPAEPAATSSVRASSTSKEILLQKSEKVKLINEELEDLLARCRSAGLNDHETRQCAGYFQNAAHQVRRKKLLRYVCIYSFLVASLCGAFYFNPTYNWISAHARLASIQFIPYYDFTKMYNDQCLVNNPLYEEPTQELSCDICKELGDAIESVTAAEASPSVIMNDFLDIQVPVVITKALGSWPAVNNKLDLDDIYKLYKESKVLRDNFSTGPHCQIVGPRDTFEDVLDALGKREDVTSFSAAWQNCEIKAYKEFRKLYRRPDFLPPAAEASQYNTVITSFGKKKEAGEFTSQSLGLVQGENDLAVWIGQVSGELHYTISPVGECSKCQTFDVYLGENDFLIVPLDLWEVSYRPVSASAPDAYAIMSGLVWDRS
ncbi:uncharacterized protein LOC135817637 [Sycon ciliatum]|uniref:uncharacterized protein LOC135817637 n=1 Tax=Sycon ciliatum TaxID=27933 RepID=UPI0020AD1CB7|eukprot:scpid57891/ scgid13214/ 